MCRTFLQTAAQLDSTVTPHRSTVERLERRAGGDAVVDHVHTTVVERTPSGRFERG
jgi:hypothetical protein